MTYEIKRLSGTRPYKVFEDGKVVAAAKTKKGAEKLVEQRKIR